MNKAKEEKISKKKTMSNKEIKKKRSQDQGITLIALVITIIILLILAGVTLNAAIGENGLFQRAKLATEKYQEAEDDEQRKMAMYEAVMNTKSTEYEDKKGKKVTIPAGFAVSQVEGENTIDDGLVIIDAKGNEFVWIPVTSLENNYTRNINYGDLNTSKNTADDKEYLPEDLKSKVEEGKTEVEIEKETVLNAKGFYISRYEAGKEKNGELVSKKGATVWDNIKQEDCKKESKKFINNSGVKSGLITGIQWDIVMGFVNNKNDGKGNTFNVEQANVDRHTENLTVSGQNDADKVCNIYDLEGNYWEYVAEKHTRAGMDEFIRRGGRFVNGSEGLTSASFRSVSSGLEGDGKSFRFVLYVLK